MSARFGHDFSRVRVHADERAGSRADALGAEAFTEGRHVSFGRGRYDPASRAGRGLLAHELAHVLQFAGVTPASRHAGSPPSVALQPKKPKKRPKKQKGKLSYFQAPSFVKHGLSPGNAGRARYLMEATPIGKGLVKWLEKRSVKVDVYYVALEGDLPVKASHPLGLTVPVSPGEFIVYVVSGYQGYTFIRQPSGSTLAKLTVKDRAADQMAETLFHELLHCWYITKHPGTGKTGHTANVKDPGGTRTARVYDVKEYEPEFLRNLKLLDKQLEKVLAEERKRKQQQKRRRR